MANVNETAGWVPGIRQFETNDPIEGGPDGVDNIALSQLASRTKYLYDLFNSVMAPIVSGKGWLLFNDIAANIPAGWAEVEEMRGRMPVGMSQPPYNSVNPATDATFGALGNTGGSKLKTLSANEMPEHTHKSGVKYGGNVVPNTGSGEYLLRDASGNGPNTVNTLIAGSGNSFSIMNPYRVVSYIKWVGL